jgi:inositol hexakisphosphate/diphosphoinositol-pentakisphosphate kinase
LGGEEDIEGIITESKILLDDSNAAKEQCDKVKLKLKEVLSSVPDVHADTAERHTRQPQASHPGLVAQEIANLMRQLRQVMRNNFASMDIESIQRRWCCHESPALFKERWERHFNDFCHDDDLQDIESNTSTSEVDAELSNANLFAPSKIPELYDTLKYDALHNRTFMTTIFVDQDTIPPPRNSDVSDTYSRTSTESSLWKVDDGLQDLKRLYHCVKMLFDYIAPQEFGMTNEEQREIGMLISLPLMKKIIKDLEEIKEMDDPRTRLYFTKGL